MLVRNLIVGSPRVGLCVYNLIVKISVSRKDLFCPQSYGEVVLVEMPDSHSGPKPQTDQRKLTAGLSILVI